MRRLGVFLMAAAVLLSCCSPTLRPTIAVVAQNGGSSFLISGTGFSNGSPCASLGATGLPGPDPNVSISKGVNCNHGSFTDFAWSPSQFSGCKANAPIAVIAVDLKTLNPAAAGVSLLCEAAVCPDSLKVAKGSPYNTLANASMPKYFASGNNVSTGPLGPTQLQEALNFSTCVPDFTYKLESFGEVSTGYISGAPKSGSFTECKYDIGSIAKKPDRCWMTPYKETLVFTCPNSGGC
jgi:hypothetical protein